MTFPPGLWQSTIYGDADAMLDFLGQHNLAHQALSDATGAAALSFDDLRTEMQRHSDVHRDIDDALGIPQTSFEHFDLADRESHNAFMLTHALQHQAEIDAAGL